MKSIISSVASSSSSSSSAGVLLAASFDPTFYLDEDIFAEKVPRWLRQHLPVDIHRVQDLFHELTRRFQALPRLTQQLSVVMMLLYVAGQILPKVFLPHSIASTNHIYQKKRFYTLLLAAFTHIDIISMLFNLVLFQFIQGEVVMHIGEDFSRFFVVLSAIITTSLPLCTDFITRQIHKHRPLAPIHQANRQYYGFFSVNIAWLYLLSAFRPDSILSLHAFLPHKQIHIKSILRAIFIFDIFGLILDVFFIPSSQSISHASNLAGFVAGVVLQHILCHTNWAKKFLRWNSRYKLCGKISF